VGYGVGSLVVAQGGPLPLGTPFCETQTKKKKKMKEAN
jgi:hypothetical protein